MSILESLKDACVYKKIKHPLSLPEALAYLNVNNIIKKDGSPITNSDLKMALSAAVSDGRLVHVHDMYWFSDIPVSDKDYLRGLLATLIRKIH